MKKIIHEGITTRYANDGTIDVVMFHPEGNKLVQDIMTISRRSALGMAKSLVRCVFKATLWKWKSKKGL